MEKGCSVVYLRVCKGFVVGQNEVYKKKDNNKASEEII